MNKWSLPAPRPAPSPTRTGPSGSLQIFPEVSHTEETRRRSPRGRPERPLPGVAFGRVGSLNLCLRFAHYQRCLGSPFGLGQLIIFTCDDEIRAFTWQGRGRLTRRAPCGAASCA